MKLFGVDIAKELAKGMAGGLPPVQLLKSTPGTRDESDPTAGTNPSERSYSCRGFMEDYREGQFDGTSVLRGDKKVLILGATLPAGIVPQPGDKVRLEGVTLTIAPEGVRRDPAAATYTCQARGS